MVFEFFRDKEDDYIFSKEELLSNPEARVALV